MRILLAVFSTKSANPTVFRMPILLVTEIVLREAYRFQKTLQTSDTQKNTLKICLCFPNHLQQKLLRLLKISLPPQLLILRQLAELSQPLLASFGSCRRRSTKAKFTTVRTMVSFNSMLSENQFEMIN